MTKADFKKRVQIITAICIVVFLTAVIILAGQFVSIISLNKKKAALEAELSLQDRESIIAGQELKYRESTDFVEQYAREILGLIKDGEEINTIEE